MWFWSLQQSDFCIIWGQVCLGWLMSHVCFSWFWLIHVCQCSCSHSYRWDSHSNRNKPYLSTESRVSALKQARIHHPSEAERKNKQDQTSTNIFFEAEGIETFCSTSDFQTLFLASIRRSVPVCRDLISVVQVKRLELSQGCRVRIPYWIHIWSKI